MSRSEVSLWLKVAKSTPPEMVELTHRTDVPGAVKMLRATAEWIEKAWDEDSEELDG